jgi:hypothetical protein
MSPTSYQAAPPRFMTIADEQREVKLRLALELARATAGSTQDILEQVALAAAL